MKQLALLITKRKRNKRKACVLGCVYAVSFWLLLHGLVVANYLAALLILFFSINPLHFSYSDSIAVDACVFVYCHCEYAKTRCFGGIVMYCVYAESCCTLNSYERKLIVRRCFIIRGFFPMLR
jgi:hypothetical protein